MKQSCSGIVRRLLVMITAAVVMLCPAAADAKDDQGFFRQWGAGIFAHQDMDLGGDDLNAAGVMVHAAAPLVDNSHMRLNLRLELSVSGYGDYGQGTEIAFTPALRLYPLCACTKGPQLYLEAGVGPAYNDVNIHELGQEFNFVSFGGLGLRLRVLTDVFLDLGLRIRHISNAGMNPRNSGVTSNQLQAGLAWDF